MRGGGRGGADRKQERAGCRAGSPPSQLSAAAAPLPAARGSPARVHPHLSVFFPRRRRLLIAARQLQQRLQRRCAKPGRSGASPRGRRGRVDSGEEAAASREGPRRCAAAGGGRGASRCGRILRGHRPRRG